MTFADPNPIIITLWFVVLIAVAYGVVAFIREANRNGRAQNPEGK